LPIHGQKAASFIGRLVFRIMKFLPVAVEHHPKFTWREMIAGMLRMSHVTEITGLLKKNGGAAYRGINYESAQLKANIAINERRSDWYEKFLGELSALVGKPIGELKRDIDLWCSMTDSMKYIQLGNPENVVIVKEDSAEVFQREIDALANNKA
jgi:hypothetical protein